MTTADHLQRRTLQTLVSSQILGGVGLSAGVAVGALLAEQVSGSATFAGLGTTFQVLGSALLAIPVTRITLARGRRSGLSLGYGLAAVGALGLIVSGIIGSFALLLAASLLLGGATTSNNQARYAATDLAPPDRVARHLSLVVWSTTIGSVLGPNLVGPSRSVADMLRIPTLTAPFAFSVVALVFAVLVLQWRLRPDPLLEARRRRVDSDVVDDHSLISGARAVMARPLARLGLFVLATGHAVMVSVMVMTPLHMRHGHAELTVIGLVISGHILGMFAFSPLVGWLVDRRGARTVALLGSTTQVLAGGLAASAPTGHSVVLTLALFLLGLGWSGTLISGSTLLTQATPTPQRPAAQGFSDLVMGLTAAAAGALAGVVVNYSGFHTLGLLALAAAASIGVATLFTKPRH